MNEILENYINKQIYEIPSILSRNLTSNEGIKYNKRDDYFKIKNRIDAFLEQGADERLLILPGLRGVGKTTLLFQCYEYLFKCKNVHFKDLLYVSCDLINRIEKVDIIKIIETYVEQVHNTSLALLDHPIFIFIDEAHYDENWALNAKIVYDQSPYIFMIITGSSSLHLNYNADAARCLKIHNVLPLNYEQHLKLKYDYHTNISEDIRDMLFTGNITNAKEKERNIMNDLLTNDDYSQNDWDNYFKYGSFTSTLNKRSPADVTSELWSIISKIISNDISNIFSLNENSRELTYRLLVFLASQKPGEISQSKIAASLNISSSKVNSIFHILEKTQLVFHYEAYGGSSKRVKKSWEYYIATSSLKNSINEEFGINTVNKKEYEEILLKT